MKHYFTQAGSIEKHRSWEVLSSIQEAWAYCCDEKCPTTTIFTLALTIIDPILWSRASEIQERTWFSLVLALVMHHSWDGSDTKHCLPNTKEQVCEMGMKRNHWGPYWGPPGSHQAHGPRRPLPLHWSMAERSHKDVRCMSRESRDYVPTSELHDKE